MKTHTLKIAIIMLLAVPMAFTSCDDDDWWSERTLTGIWHTRDDYGDSYTQVRFEGDGTGMISQYDYGRLTDEAYFYWSANRHSIYFDFDDRPSERWNIRFDGRNAFRLYFDDGSYTYFVRDY